MVGVSSHSTLSLRLASSVSCPGSLIKVAQERDLSNVFVVVENRLSQCWSSFPHSPDIQASLTQTHQSTGHWCRVTRPGSGLRQAGRAIVMQQIDQVSQDTAKLSICRTVHTA